MQLPALFLLVISLVVSMGLAQESCYLSEEEEDQCASVCYPIVKPLLRYFKVCQTKDRTIAEVQSSLNKVNLKYIKLLEKHTEDSKKYENYLRQDFKGRLHETNNLLTQNYRQYLELKTSFEAQKSALTESQRVQNETNNKCAELQKKLDEVNSQNAKLQEQNSEVQKRLNDLNIKYELLEEKHTTAHNRCTEAEGRLAQMQEKLDNTNRELGQSQGSRRQIIFEYEQVQDKFKKVNIENEEFRKKELQVKNLETQITEKSTQIKVLNDRISDLEKSSELGKLNKLFSEELEKLLKITQSGQEVKIIGSGNNDSKMNSVTKTGATNTTTSPSNSETPIRVLPDRCPSTQNKGFSYPEIQIPGLEPFKAACYSNKYVGSGWMLIYYKFNDSEEFNRTYDEYINGFGDLQAEDVMGLEKLHILTNWKPHEVYITDIENIMICDNFVVGDKIEGYMLKELDGCTGDTEKFDLIQGTKFSTFDRDEDGIPNKNCAKELGFGWWWQSSEPKYIDNRDYLQILIRRKDSRKQSLFEKDFGK